MTTLWVKTIIEDEWVNLRFCISARVRPTGEGDEADVVFYDAGDPTQQYVVFRGPTLEAGRLVKELLASMNAGGRS